MDRVARRRFWAKVSKVGNGGCWIWTGATTSGYGRIKVDGRVRGAHRLSWEMGNGDRVPSGKFVCHSCDNRKCVRPGHLFLSDHQGNMRDAAEKRRLRGNRRGGPSRPGQENSQARLRSFEVWAILDLLALGFAERGLAREFAVSLTTIKYIRSGRRWGSVLAAFRALDRAPKDRQVTV